MFNCMINGLSMQALRGEFYAVGSYNFTVGMGRGESSPGRVGLAARQDHSAASTHPAWASVLQCYLGTRDVSAALTQGIVS